MVPNICRVLRHQFSVYLTRSRLLRFQRSVGVSASRVFCVHSNPVPINDDVTSLLSILFLELLPLNQCPLWEEVHSAEGNKCLSWSLPLFLISPLRVWRPLWIPGQDPASLTLLLILGRKFRQQPLAGRVVHTRGQKLESTCKASVQRRAPSYLLTLCSLPEPSLCLLNNCICTAADFNHPC